MITETDKSSLTVEIKAELELLEKLKPFVAYCLTLNHDINNLLAGVIGYTEFVLTEPLQMTPDQISLLEKAFACAERIKKQMEELSKEKARLGTPKEVEKLIETFLSTPDNQEQTE